MGGSRRRWCLIVTRSWASGMTPRALCRSSTSAKPLRRRAPAASMASPIATRGARPSSARGLPAHARSRIAPTLPAAAYAMKRLRRSATKDCRARAASMATLTATRRAPILSAQGTRAGVQLPRAPTYAIAALVSRLAPRWLAEAAPATRLVQGLKASRAHPKVARRMAVPSP